MIKDEEDACLFGVPHGLPTEHRSSIAGSILLAIAGGAVSFAFSAVAFGFWFGVTVYLLAGGATLVLCSMISAMSGYRFHRKLRR